MNKHHTYTNNLLFLLAAAPMGMGCIIVTDDTDETEGAETNGNQTSTTGEATGETTAGTDTPVTGDGTGSTGRTDSSGVDSTATSDDTTTGGISGVCADYGALAVECMQVYSEYAAENCAFQLEYLEAYSPECADAYTAFISCLSALSCEELQSDAPCQAELDAFLALACPTAE